MLKVIGTYRDEKDSDKGSLSLVVQGCEHHTSEPS